jgi:hypothetical protein
MSNKIGPRAAWRKFAQAAEAIDEADEAEEFQAVGMRCREALVKFARDAAESEKIAVDGSELKKGDFVAALTHEDDATRHNAEIAISATETVLAAFSDALVRFDPGRGRPAHVQGIREKSG